MARLLRSGKRHLNGARARVGERIAIARARECPRSALEISSSTRPADDEQTLADVENRVEALALSPGHINRVDFGRMKGAV